MGTLARSGCLSRRATLQPQEGVLMSKETEALDDFGEMLIRKVRGNSILDWDKIIDGRIKGATAEKVRPWLASFTLAQREVLSRLLPLIVDTVLHHLLWRLEQSDETRLVVETQAGPVTNLAEASENFPGELYTPEGWIARFT